MNRVHYRVDCSTLFVAGAPRVLAVRLRDHGAMLRRGVLRLPIAGDVSGWIATLRRHAVPSDVCALCAGARGASGCRSMRRLCREASPSKRVAPEARA